jgi:hypothetical protein
MRNITNIAEGWVTTVNGYVVVAVTLTKRLVVCTFSLGERGHRREAR